MSSFSPPVDSYLGYLKSLPAPVLFALIPDMQSGSRSIISSASISSLHHDLVDSGGAVDRFDALSTPAQALCALVYLMGQEGVTDSSDAGTALLESLLVCGGTDPDGRRILFGFTELYPLLEERLAALLEKEWAVDKTFRRSVRDPVQTANDFALLLAEAGAGRLRKTRQGTLLKKAATRLKKIVHGWSPGWRTAGEAGCILLLDYACAEGLCRDEPEGYTLCRERAESLLSRKPAEIHAEIATFCREAGSRIRWPLFERLLATGKWFSFDRIGEEGARQTLIDAGIIADVLGLLTLRREGNTLLWAGSEWNREPETGCEPLTVLPDFSAIIGGSVCPETLFTFTLVGEIETLDNVYHGAVCRERCAAALVAGVEPDLLIDTLGRWRVPDNVLTSVKEWIREFFRLGVSTGGMIVSRDPAVTASLESFEPVARHCTKHPADAVFLIAPERVREVTDRLSTLGFDVRFPQTTPPAPSPALTTGSAGRRTLSLVTAFTRQEPRATSTAGRSGKYGETREKRELSEVLQIVDYAILMGYSLTFDYKGSEGVRKGTYTAEPREYKKGMHPTMTAVTSGRRDVTFLLESIETIGVLEQ